MVTQARRALAASRSRCRLRQAARHPAGRRPLPDQPGILGDTRK